MILTCPSCQSRYVVPDSAIGATGRKVRCANCRHSWFQEAPSGAVAPTMADSPLTAPSVPAPPAYAPPPPPPRATPLEERPMASAEEPAWDETPAYEEPPFRPRRNRARMWTIVAIVAGLAMLVAAAAVMFLGLPLGRQIGIPVQSGYALAIVDQRAQPQRLESGNDVLEVSGTIVNQTDEVQRVPQIQAELRDETDRVVYSWTIAPPVRELQPRGRIAFNSANVGVPRGGRAIRLTLGPTT